MSIMLPTTLENHLSKYDSYNIVEHNEWLDLEPFIFEGVLYGYKAYVDYIEVLHTEYIENYLYTTIALIEYNSYAPKIIVVKHKIDLPKITFVSSNRHYSRVPSPLSIEVHLLDVNEFITPIMLYAIYRLLHNVGDNVVNIELKVTIDIITQEEIGCLDQYIESCFPYAEFEEVDTNILVLYKRELYILLPLEK